tara:strand:- start:8857 stop:9297 length:441 start_codon:yes stop_codon:yes gene_type:complete
VNIENIMDLWSEDVKMDNVDLDTESLKIPNLHAKWLNILTKERQKLRRLTIKKQQLSKTLAEYYRGELNNPEDLAIIKREPYLKTVLKAEINTYVDTDSDMIELNLRVSYQQEIVDVVEEIMKAINGRQWNIRNAIEWRKFSNGAI